MCVCVCVCVCVCLCVCVCVCLCVCVRVCVCVCVCVFMHVVCGLLFDICIDHIQLCEEEMKALIATVSRKPFTDPSAVPSAVIGQIKEVVWCTNHLSVC